MNFDKEKVAEAAEAMDLGMRRVLTLPPDLREAALLSAFHDARASLAAERGVQPADDAERQWQLKFVRDVIEAMGHLCVALTGNACPVLSKLDGGLLVTWRLKREGKLVLRSWGLETGPLGFHVDGGGDDSGPGDDDQDFDNNDNDDNDDGVCQ